MELNSDLLEGENSQELRSMMRSYVHEYSVTVEVRIKLWKR